MAIFKRVQTHIWIKWENHFFFYLLLQKRGQFHNDFWLQNLQWSFSLEKKIKTSRATWFFENKIVEIFIAVKCKPILDKNNSDKFISNLVGHEL